MTTIFNPKPLGQTVEGLQPLSETDQLFVVRQDEPLQLMTGVPMQKYFKILNNQGQHILSGGQVETILSECSKFSCLFFICSVQGNILLTLSTRNETCYARRHGQDAMECFYHADVGLATTLIELSKIDSKSELKSRKAYHEYDTIDPEGYLHLRLVNGGSFLGHYWENNKLVVIYNTNFTRILAISQLDPNQQTYLQDFDDPLIDSMKRKQNRRDKLNSNLVNYEILDLETSKIVGKIEAYQNLQNFNYKIDPKSCYGATFPNDFIQVDKVLVLGFLLYKQRVVSHDKLIFDIFNYFVVVIFVLVNVVGAFLFVFYEKKNTIFN